jgi:hypothetical protein
MGQQIVAVQLNTVVAWRREGDGGDALTDGNMTT